jgi:hypothetical protein
MAMPEIRLTNFEGQDHRGAVFADGMSIGSWQVQRWVRGRARVYVAWLEDGQTLVDEAPERLARKIRLVLG